MKIIKLYIFTLLMLTSINSYAVDNTLSKNKVTYPLEQKIFSLNEIIDTKIKDLQIAMELNDDSFNIYNEIKDISDLLSQNMVLKNTLNTIQKEVDILTSEIVDDLIDERILTKIKVLNSKLNNELNEIIIKKNIYICKQYSFIEDSDAYNKCLLSLLTYHSTIYEYL